MAVSEKAPMISAATAFSQLLIDNIPLTEAFNRSGLGRALEDLFAGPHAKVYHVPDKGIWYVPSNAKVNLPKAGLHIADMVFFDNPRDRGSAYFIERVVWPMDDGQRAPTYTLCLQNREAHGDRYFADTIASISGVWAGQAAVGRLFENVNIVNTMGQPAATEEYIFTLDRLLKSPPLAGNPLWTAPKPLTGVDSALSNR